MTKLIRPSFKCAILVFYNASGRQVKVSVDVLHTFSVRKIQAAVHLYIDLLLNRAGDRRVEKKWSLPSRGLGADGERQSSKLSVTMECNSHPKQKCGPDVRRAQKRGRPQACKVKTVLSRTDTEPASEGQQEGAE